MKIRPIYWGLIISLIGTLGWVFSIILAIVTFGEFKFLAKFFGVLMMLGIPIGILVEIVLHFFKKKN